MAARLWAQRQRWQSEELKDAGDWINLKLAKPQQIHQVRLTFDPNLSEEICISVSKAFIEKEKRGIPERLVRDYDVVLNLCGREIGRKQVEGNHQRLNIVEFPSVKADEIRIEVHTTNGSHTARIFEIRVY
ncbi:MAG: hypothetical protein LKG56_09865 [Lachnospiraceae bacterium]|nr:hypothetical protein [Lachnospiraceae bacterium]MCI1361973.1 hypothetical protein [Lachnospiraceae bacterium]MCI1381318.1 hypothetical protein [Lachnospiraceae bacterium]MCI1402367.1 hypothetical protein [Lachnospiraceae bacterium]MCI1431017.1 hypothetical protein [Lachnospiraceae bacterium]